MRRKLFTILAALSLLLCVATAALWVRSYQVADWAGHYDGVTGAGGATSAFGRIYIFCSSDEFPAAAAGWDYRRSELKQWDVSSKAIFTDGPQFGFERIGGTAHLILPYWFLCALSALLPAGWGCARFFHKPVGHCRSCGYDLRATPDRCPECGTITAKDETMKAEG